MWPSFSPTSVKIIAGLCACVGVASAWADTGAGAYTFTGRRLVHSFDFEEAKFNNFEDLPMYWYPIGRSAVTTDRNFMRQPVNAEMVATPGFPAYTAIRFDRPQSEEGNHQLYLGLNGGSAGAFVEAGAVPAVPHSDYLITAEVRTTSLRYARARMTAYFMDNTGRRIEDSRIVSDLVQTDGRPERLSVKLHGDFPDAAWIGIHVELLQPQQQTDEPTSRHEVLYQEVEGGAWFDDINVWQLPHISVRTQTPINVIRSPNRPRLSMRLRDLTARPLNVQVNIYDHRLRHIASDRRRVDEWTPVNWSWQPPLEKHGWYIADMTVLERSGEEATAPMALVARALASFLWLADEPIMHADDANRFRILAEGVTDEEFRFIPQLLDQTRLSSAVLSAWSPYTSLKNNDQRQRALADVIQSVVGAGGEVALNLAPVPDELAQSFEIHEHTPLMIFSRAPSIWEPYLLPVLMRHGQRVRYWQMGAIDRAYAFFNTDLTDLTRSITDTLRRMAPQPRVVLPWRLDQDRRPDMPSSLVYLLDVPISVAPDHINGALEPWRSSPTPDFWLHLRETPATEMAHHRRITGMVLRMLRGWEAQPSGLATTRPWARSTGRRFALYPDPLLGAFTTVAHRLAGRRAIGMLPLDEGLACMIFDGSSGGMLAAWNQKAMQEEAVLHMYLGPKPQSVDVWGNRRDVPLVGNRHYLPLDATPIFIEGIDPQLAMFRASFQVDPAFIESTVTEHNRVIRFSNPWPQTISGFLTILEPEHWDIQPKRHRFSIASGQTATVPLQLNFPVTELAGIKKLTAQFDFIAHQRYNVQITTGLELGLSNVGFDATLEHEVHPETGVSYAVITEMITNKSDRTTALYAFAHTVGAPRQERIIAQLEPGQLVVRRFRFPLRGNGQEIVSKNFRVGVRETSGPAVLNMILSGKDLSQ